MRVLLLTLLLTGAGCLGTTDPSGDAGTDAPAGPRQPEATGPEDPVPDDAEGPEGGPAEPGGAPGPRVLRASGVTQTNTGVWGQDHPILEAGHAIPVHLTANDTVVYELDWADTFQDLDPWVVRPVGDCGGDWVGNVVDYSAAFLLDGKDDGIYRDTGGHIGAPDAVVRMHLDETMVRPHVCDCPADDDPQWRDCGVWLTGWRSKVANAGVPWEAAVSVFQGPVPPGYAVLG